MKYFIKQDGDQHGPFSQDQILLRLDEHGYDGEHLVRGENEQEWKQLKSAKEFQSAARNRTPESNRLAIASLLLGFGAIAALSSYPVLRGEAAGLAGAAYWALSFLGFLTGWLALRRISYSSHGAMGYRTARVGWILGIFLTFVLPVIAPLIPVGGCHISERGNQVKAISNCRQVMTALRIYADDHGGRYPDALLHDATTSNAVFRELFRDGVLDNEAIFSGPLSPFSADETIGNAPDYAEAVKPGENHWAMTKGLTASSDARIPLVFENPVQAIWPPKWNSNFAGKSRPGRTWTRGPHGMKSCIVIGFNDGSVSEMPLEADKGDSVGLKPNSDTTPVFPDLKPIPMILNVER